MFKPIRLAQNSIDLLPYYLGAFTLSSELRAQMLNLVAEQQCKLKAAKLQKQQKDTEEKLKIARLKAEIWRKL